MMKFDWVDVVVVLGCAAIAVVVDSVLETRDQVDRLRLYVEQVESDFVGFTSKMKTPANEAADV